MCAVGVQVNPKRGVLNDVVGNRVAGGLPAGDDADGVSAVVVAVFDREAANDNVVGREIKTRCATSRDFDDGALRRGQMRHGAAVFVVAAVFLVLVFAVIFVTSVVLVIFFMANVLALVGVALSAENGQLFIDGDRFVVDSWRDANRVARLGGVYGRLNAS